MHQASASVRSKTGTSLGKEHATSSTDTSSECVKSRSPKNGTLPDVNIDMEHGLYYGSLDEHGLEKVPVCVNDLPGLYGA